jgi:hypothetical protein
LIVAFAPNAPELVLDETEAIVLAPRLITLDRSTDEAPAPNPTSVLDAKLEWLPQLLGTTGLPFASTNVMRKTLVETNGINTVLALKASARRVGALTNTQFRVYYDPAVR